MIKKITRKMSDVSPLPNIQPEFPINSNITTHYTDIVQTIHKSDGVSMLRFFTQLPAINFETCRIALPTHVVKNLVDILCHTLDYYPEKKSRENASEK